mmetsp:Transcript_2500/g.4474  ORF Transcript_2500/g.4474 Transcript_2500/m.4474 type:complete len:1319 (-) Transcript_2500:130-4086(-)
MSVIQEIPDKGAVMAWCPIKSKSTYIALGAKDGANEQTFDDYGGELDIYSVNFDSKSQPKFVGKAETSTRFNCLAWGAKGPGDMGIIAGGMQNGAIHIWNPSKLGDPLATVQKHKAKVNALQFHPCAGTEHLLATGASDNEVYIVDLNKPEHPNVHSPAGPGSQKHRAEVRAVAWNLEVQHVLATAAMDAACTVWSLKAKKPWAEIRDPSGCGISAIAWSPVRGLHHLLTASSDDRDPVLRLWDVRSSTTQPLAEYRGHSAGIFSLSWCPDDSSYFMSCGKDNRTLFWDLYSGKPVAEVYGDGGKHDTASIGNGGAVPTGLGAPPSSFGSTGNNDFFGAAQNNGSDVFGGMGGIASNNKGRRYQVTFSPHNRTIFASCSFDRKVQVLSINGACGGVEEAQKAVNSQPPYPMRAPSWTRRKCGAAFGFGGKIVHFGSAAPMHPSNVRVCQFAEENEIVQNCVNWEEQYSNSLNMDVQAQQQTGSATFSHMSELCQTKASAATSRADREAWSFMKILFEPSARDKILEQLGFDMESINKLVASLDTKAAAAAAEQEAQAAAAAEAAASNYDESQQYLSEQQDNMQHQGYVDYNQPLQSPQGFSQVQQQMEQLRLQGMNGGGMNGIGSDAAGGSSVDVFDDFTHMDNKNDEDAFGEHDQTENPQGEADAPAEHQPPGSPEAAGPDAGAASPVASPVKDLVKPARSLDDVCLEDVESKDPNLDDTIGKALLVGNFSVAVECCLENNRFADALLLSSCGGADLWNETLAKYLDRFYHKKPYIPVLSAVIQQDLETYVRRSDVSGDNWKEVLAIVSQYGKSDQVPMLCEILASKLEEERNDEEASIAACLCYICAKNVEKTVDIFLKQGAATLGSKTSTVDRIKLSQSIVEKTQVYMQALEDSSAMMSIPNVMAHYIDYATFLASQGLLEYAAKYISTVDTNILQAQPQQMYDEHGNVIEIPVESCIEEEHNKQAVRALMLMDRIYGAHTQPEYGLSQYIPGPVKAFDIKQFGVAPSNTPWVPVETPQHQTQPQQPMNNYGQANGMPSSGYAQPQQQLQQQQQTQQPMYQPQPTYNSPQIQSQQAPQPQQQSMYGQQTQPQQPAMSNMYGQQTQSQPSMPQPSYSQPSSSAPQPLPPSQPTHIHDHDGFGSTAGNPLAGQKYGNLHPQQGYNAGYNDSNHMQQQQQQQQQQQGIFNPNASQQKAPTQEPSPQPVQRVMPPQMAPSMQMLEQHMKALATRIVSSMDKRKFADAEKGVNALKDKLMTGAVAEDLYAEITQLIQALASNDYTAANAVLQALTARSHVWAEHKDWIRGMRPLALFSRR